MQKVDDKFYAFDDSFETIKETFSAASLLPHHLAHPKIATPWPIITCQFHPG